jgi:ABC-type lipoprotein export system ATPase subunit
MAETVLSCAHVAKRFSSRGRTTEVLRDIDLRIGKGEIAVIQGRSGEGKSTLLHILAGLDRPSSGSVEIVGKALDALTSSALASLRRQAMGFIFQNFNLIPSWTAGQNVEAALAYSGRSRIERRRMARGMLESLGLGERIDYLPSELSVGQQQRVAVARALIHAPAIVFADEPAGDVDPETAESIMDCLIDSVRDQGGSLVLCTHGRYARADAAQVHVLRDGTLYGP